jgi:two-component system, chemotaxis family, protein-glutamate methylesterase/glutaminase
VKDSNSIRVLVIDDSAANRRSIAKMLDEAPGIEVIARAGDGEEGLKQALLLKPDVITADLEMPRLDGFSFLRILQARLPIPVIILSSYAHQSDVIKALHLGAFDFVAKGSGSAMDSIRTELVAKVRAAAESTKTKPAPRALAPAKQVAPEVQKPLALSDFAQRPMQVVVVGASTGGPPAVQAVLEALAGTQVCVVIAQHMPAKFTEAFAQRLDQVCSFRVSEASSGAKLEPGKAFVGPGGKHFEIVERRGKLALEVFSTTVGDTHSPSVDRLFSSAAQVLGPSANAVILTGMGSDGALGVRALADKGATVWAEGESTAVVFGMPQAAIATKGVKHILGLHDLKLHLRNYLMAQK